jgi:ribosomal protein S18 acetylase RimI-like enzyme
MQRLDDAVTTLADAFFADPLIGWVFEDPSRRAGQLQVWWRWMIDNLPAHGELSINPTGTSAAIWYGPDPAESDTGSDFVAMLSGLVGPTVAQEKLRGLSVIPAAHPHGERHWYLAAVGTRVGEQSSGQGRMLLDTVLRRADEAQVASYLESSNERNVAFYERLGFVRTGTIQIPGGPSLTPMWRTPRQDGEWRTPRQDGEWRTPRKR